MIDYASFKRLRLEELSTAAQDWGDAAAALRETAEAAHTEVRPLILGGVWSGEAAAQGREAVHDTMRRFAHARDHAEQVRNLLNDLHENLSVCRGRLTAIEHSAQERRMRIDAEGRVRADPLPPGSEAWDPEAVRSWQPDESELAHVASSIRRVLDDVAGFDAAATHALRELTADEVTFQPVTPVNIDDLEKEMAEALDEAVELVEQEEMTESDVEKLEGHLREFGAHPDFAESFVVRVGAEGLLDFWGGFHHVGTRGELDQDALNSLAETFGTVLGQATQRDSADIRQWEDDMVRLGDERVFSSELGENPYGFQVMGNLMNHGEYGDRFVTKYSDAFAETEMEADTALALWGGAGSVSHYNTAFGEDFQMDPAAGIMSALGRAPDAATDFFAKDERVEYFMRDRDELLGAEHTTDDGRLVSRQAIGDAIAAAATGVTPGDLDAELDRHPTDRVLVRDAAMDVAQEMGNDFPPEFRSPMAHVLGGHSEYVFEMTNTSGGEKRDDAQRIAEVSAQIARDPKAYVTLNNLMMNGYSDQIHGDWEDHSNTVHLVNRSLGFIEQSRYSAMEIDGDDSAWQAQDVYNSLGSVIGSFPVAGNALNHALDAVTSRWAEGMESEYEEEMAETMMEYMVEESGYREILAEGYLNREDFADLSEEEQREEVDRFLNEGQVYFDQGREAAEKHVAASSS